MHWITGRALQDFYDECVRVSNQQASEVVPSVFPRFERPLFAFSWDFPESSQPPAVDATAWLVAADGDGTTDDKRGLCWRDRWGHTVAGGQVGGTDEPKGDPYLYQIVDGRHLFISPVATVTYQPKTPGGVETYAVVRDGMWFYPEYTPTFANDEDLLAAGLDGGLIHLLGGRYRYRGYDANGKLVYDSERDGPFARDCHTDPTGTKVFHTAGKPDASPETCERTYEWTAP
ncbi:hypothetical protein [Flindersiella endophytica]